MIEICYFCTVDALYQSNICNNINAIKNILIINNTNIIFKESKFFIHVFTINLFLFDKLIVQI